MNDLNEGEVDHELGSFSFWQIVIQSPSADSTLVLKSQATKLNDGFVSRIFSSVEAGEK